MKRGRKEPGFADIVVMVAAVCGALIAIGLCIPSVRPLAFQVGTVFSLVIVAVGIGVALYAGWRILTFPYRRRRAWLRGAEIRAVSNGSSAARPAAAGHRSRPGRQARGLSPRPLAAAWPQD